MDFKKFHAEQLPEQIVWRKDKVGFEPPQLKWMQDKRMMRAGYGKSKALVKENILKPAVMQEPLQANAAHESGKR